MGEQNDHDASETNQCDGCRRKLPVDEHGLHRGPTTWDVIACTADRYGSEPAEGGDADAS